MKIHFLPASLGSLYLGEAFASWGQATADHPTDWGFPVFFFGGLGAAIWIALIFFALGRRTA